MIARNLSDMQVDTSIDEADVGRIRAGLKASFTVDAFPGRSFEGTVVAVTHDRWFARSFDRYLVFGSDATVREALEPVWDEARPARAG